MHQVEYSHYYPIYNCHSFAGKCFTIDAAMEFLFIVYLKPVKDT